MPLNNFPLTKKDFEELQLDEIIKKCDRKECERYFLTFFTKADEAKAAGEAKTEEIFALLGNATSMMLKLNSPTEPFTPLSVLYNSRSAIIDDFSEDHLKFFSEIVLDISDSELRARIADILWVKKRDFRAAELAITSYLDSATILEDPVQWPKCADRIERAVRLAASLGKNTGHLDEVISHIETTLDKYNGEDPKFLSEHLMGLLLEFRRGDSAKYSALSEKLAKRAESDGDWRRARIYWETKARWHKLAKDADNERTARIRAAETYVEDAEAAINRETPSYVVAADHMGRAIESYRRIGGASERIEKLHHTMLEYQKISINELKHIPTDIDLTEVVNNSIARVKGKTFYDALFEFALMVRSPEVSNLRKEVQKLAKEYIGRHLVPVVAINEKGKVVGSSADSIFSNDPNEVEAAMRANMFKRAEFHHAIDTQGIIEPVRCQINLEHNVRVSDFIPIVSNNPLIPEEREQIYAQGLHAGMEGDFLVAAHLLIPQFENSIRHVLEQCGVITSGIDSKGIQDERSLNTTLYLPEMHDVFGEDITFDLQGLLTERFGTNLRNQMAHGLMSHDAFYLVPVAYLWWLILRLCCVPIIMQIKENEAQQMKDSVSGSGTTEPREGAV
jgi:hypothetical protein